MAAQFLAAVKMQIIVSKAKTRVDDPVEFLSMSPLSDGCVDFVVAASRGSDSGFLLLFALGFRKVVSYGAHKLD